jgi:hypothetical protein
MKCNRIAVYGWKTKKVLAKKPIILFTLESPSDLNPEYYPKSWILSHQEVCNGDITSQIELEFIPYMGGSDVNIEVRFKCNKCSYEYAGENGLPSDIDDLNTFLTKIIKEM